ncbi:MAG TPA: LLM class flavin-dependent oxidoreductase [Ktedonobacterales bacterium]
MRYGFIIPAGDIDEIAGMARDAEDAGWDGVFYWDGIYIADMGRMWDPWVTLAAMALRTERVRIGVILTPLSRRRPWKVARETVTVDHLAHGRLVLPVGLGALEDGGFSRVNEITDRKARAERLDEGLDILTGLWSGAPFSYQGKHFQLQEMTFVPPPVQRPRIPIWVAGAWPRAKSMDRVARYDGLLPSKIADDGTFQDVTPDDIQAMRTYITEHRALTTPFDIVMEGETPGDDPARAAAIVRPFAEAGATWWTESMWSARDTTPIRTRILQGPPRVDATATV